MSDETKKAMDEAAAEHSRLHSAYYGAKSTLESEWAPKLAAARSAYDAAKRAHDLAVADETPDHPLHGRKVFRMQNELAKWAGRVIGQIRIDGVIDTYRPGANLGRGYNKPSYLNPGDPFVRILLKSGKVGSSCEGYVNRFDEETRWVFADEASPNPSIPTPTKDE